jgi:hypothetical protein
MAGEPERVAGILSGSRYLRKEWIYCIRKAGDEDEG